MSSRIYVDSISEIDKRIEIFNKGDNSLDANTKYLVQHSKKKILAPLKECICRGGKKSKNYLKANGNEAYKYALKLGYVSFEEPWEKGDLKREDYSKLKDKKYFVLRFLPSKTIQSTYLKYIKHEQELRDLMGRPNERNEPLGQFGELLYCKLFGCSSNTKLNTKGFDAINPVTQERIQIKVARKALTNKQGIDVSVEKDMFDVLAIFWLGANRKIKKYFEISQKEFLKIANSKKAYKGKVALVETDFNEKLLKRSRKRIIEACERHGLKELLDIE